ncbi:glycosyltransferase family protein [Paenibacillus phocaensis]|uniref:glycosyltransferase family protein n=1 Tax=Paenibacillus phocaensis TaxID=1776378 RepID=UPI000AC7D7A2|nr:glycosyltransferase [Paenibacillus phocaensis]
MTSNAYCNEQFMKKTSIIILCHNNLEYTKQCIESIRQYTDKSKYELVVIDNGSFDGTKNWLLDQEDIIAVYNSQNEGIARGYNQGIEVSNGETLAFLDNDVIVTENWLDNLLAGLYSSEEVGAVGPISNNADSQSVVVNYQNLEQMFNLARNNNISNSQRWENRVNLYGFLLLVKREVIQKIGLFDEDFSLGLFEDDDYCFRMISAGYKLVLCKDVFVHHYAGVTSTGVFKQHNNMMSSNKKKFKDKWGFDGRYSSYVRTDLLSLLDSHDVNETIRVLEVGCACGATLLDIKNRYKNAELYGIELNEAAAKIASTFARVTAENVENEIDYEENYFDYILFPDVLEHLYDPWKVVKKLKKHLKKNGKLLASIPNVMHYTVLRNTILGKWEYEDRGLMDRTHIRFFTLREIQKMFEEAEYFNTEIRAKTILIPDEDEKWIRGLAELSNLGGESFSTNLDQQYRVYQYLVKSYNSNPFVELSELIKLMNSELVNDEVSQKFIENIIENNVGLHEIIRLVEENTINQIDTYNCLVNEFYKRGLSEYIIPLLSQALSLAPQDKDTLFNLGYILFEATEYKLALSYLQQIKDDELDEEIHQMIAVIREKWIANTGKYRIAIKIAADRETMQLWGDYHMALGLKKQFQLLGHEAIIQVYPDWYNGEDEDFNVVIVLRGLHAYEPKRRHINIMWNISHPDLVDINEMNQYDYVFIASDFWADQINPTVHVPVESMLQCTDPELFNEQGLLNKHIQLLFVGNSRFVHRKVIKDLLPTDYDLHIYGNGWESYVDPKYIKGRYIPNHELSQYYSSCDILLNDHWDDMRDKGFISNRIFDALAAEAFIISDHVRGIEEVFGDGIVTYDSREELQSLIHFYLENPQLRKEMARKYAQEVIDKHTYRHRATTFIQTIHSILQGIITK